MQTKISLAFAHTPWVPQRVESFSRLLESLAIPEDVVSNVFKDKEPNWSWSHKMWSWSCAQDVEWCVFLQDDTIVCPDFWNELDEALKIANKHNRTIVGLHVAHPSAHLVWETGHTAFTTCDAIVGVAYAVRRDTLKEFLEWRDRLGAGAVDAISEDSLIALFATVTDKNVFHLLPAIVDHDTSIPSTYGNDNHKNRKTTLRWDNWRGVRLTPGVSDAVPHLGRFYLGLLGGYGKYLHNLSEKDLRELISDDGHNVQRRLRHIRLAYGPSPKAKVLIATPSRGQACTQYAASIWNLLRDESIDYNLEIADVQVPQMDVVRVRSRTFDNWLKCTDATHLLFVDDDIEFSPACIAGMLASGEDFVFSPYPRREGVNWKAVEKSGPPHAYRYALGLLDNSDGLEVKENGCVEVKEGPLGCALISRAGAEKLMAYVDDKRRRRLGLGMLLLKQLGETNDIDLKRTLYSVADELMSHLQFVDKLADGSVRKTDAVFQLAFKNRGGGRGLLSEDFSFCDLWRESGQRVFMYLGQGSPVTHHGHHAYEGNIEAFGLRRV